MGTTSAKYTIICKRAKKQVLILFVSTYVIKVRKGYSPNTLEAYIRDVDKLLKFLADEQKIPQEAKLEDIENFAATIGDLGIGARSVGSNFKWSKAVFIVS